MWPLVQSHRDGFFVVHIDWSADNEITWTVHLVNKKAVTRNSGSAADLTIDLRIPPAPLGGARPFAPE